MIDLVLAIITLAVGMFTGVFLGKVYGKLTVSALVRFVSMSFALTLASLLSPSVGVAIAIPLGIIGLLIAYLWWSPALEEFFRIEISSNDSTRLLGGSVGFLVGLIGSLAFVVADPSALPLVAIPVLTATATVLITGSVLWVLLMIVFLHTLWRTYFHLISLVPTKQKRLSFSTKSLSKPHHQTRASPSG
jgi:hypothetical protein